MKLLLQKLLLAIALVGLASQLVIDYRQRASIKRLVQLNATLYPALKTVTQDWSDTTLQLYLHETALAEKVAERQQMLQQAAYLGPFQTCRAIEEITPPTPDLYALAGQCQFAHGSAQLRALFVAQGDGYALYSLWFTPVDGH